MNYTLAITYDGEPDYELEDELIAILKKSGYEPISTGFNFKTQIRDLNFEALNKFVRCGEDE